MSTDDAAVVGAGIVGLATSRELLHRHPHPTLVVLDKERTIGFQRLAARYWRTGLAEVVRDLSTRAFLRSPRRSVPELTLRDMEPGPPGVRAQALGSAGRLVDDVVVDVQESQMAHVRNAHSPAATSSLAIGRLVADTAERAFGWME